MKRKETSFLKLKNYKNATGITFINGCNTYQFNSHYSLHLPIPEAGKPK